MSIFLNLFFITLFGAIQLSDHTLLIDFINTNAVLQLALFIGVACVPFIRTKRVSYVDIAWPFGVALIGLQIILIEDAELWRKLIVGGIYLFIGLRMGIGAVVMASKTGMIYQKEFPRYQYRRMLLETRGSKYVDLHLLAEIMAQGAANITVLALPGILFVLRPEAQFSVLEIIGISLWGLAYLIESVADGQKLVFSTNNAKGVCNIGLWKFSRHPNYFAEWLVWTGLVIASIPSLLENAFTPLIWGTLAIGTFSASVMMYITLVYLTGAKPAEYYSVQKREGYREYQQKTNMFFPWFPRG